MLAIIKFTLRYCLVVSMCLSTLIGRSQADWIVIPSDYEYNMNVIGVGFIECDAIHDEQDRIAAFVGDEIRGVQFLMWKVIRDCMCICLFTAIDFQGIPSILKFTMHQKIAFMSFPI